MKLSRKILLLAVLNLAALGVALAVFARVQLGVGAESLLLGPAKDHILAIANSFRAEFDLMPEKQQAELLPAYGRHYNATFYLTNPSGHALIGSDAGVSC